MVDFLQPAPDAAPANIGAMDQDFCTLLATGASNLAGYTSPTSVGKVWIANCAGVALYINYDVNTAATDFELYWYFSDALGTDLYLPSSMAVAAGALTLTPMSLNIPGDLKTVIHIPNPGAHIIDFYIDANATPNDSDLGLHVIRTGVVSGYVDDN